MIANHQGVPGRMFGTTAVSVGYRMEYKSMSLFNRGFCFSQGTVWYTVYDGEGDPPAVSPPPPPPPVADDDKPMLSQKQVNDILAKEKKKAQDTTQKVIAELESAKKARGLTEQERDGLQSRIEELTRSMMSKEEIAARDKKALEEGYKKELEGTRKERDTWRGKHDKAEIKRALSDEAKAANAFDDAQIVKLLASDTRMVEITDGDGKGTGEYEPRTTVETEKDGKTVFLDVSVKEAIKIIKENPRYGNLFKDTKAGGLGAGRAGDAGKGGGKSHADMTSPEWREYRKKSGLRNASR